MHAFPKSAVWIYDVGKYVRSTAPETTWKKFFDKLLQKMVPPPFCDATSIHFVIDKYIEDSTKSGARKNRGETKSIRINVTGLGQEMPATADHLHLALSNSITKKSMYLLFVNYLKSGNAPISLPTVVNDEDITWEIHPSGEHTQIFVCNHEEADTRMIYHATLQGKNDVVIVANDTDVLFLGAYACALDESKKWFVNYEYKTFADLAKFAIFYGDLTLNLPMFHSITGCDTTSYFHYRGKTDPW